MPYRTVPLVNNFFYHIFNRGVEKRKIFLTKGDFLRFLKILIYYQFESPKPRFSRFNPLVHKGLSEQKIVDIVAYCLMPNHFHFLLKQNRGNGISEYLSKISNSYTKYFNTKYKRVGPLFQGPFKAVIVSSDEQLSHLSRYIHLNPVVSGLAKQITDYPWSSFVDYLDISQSTFVHLGGVIEKTQIIDLIGSSEEYKKFVLNHQNYAMDLEIIKHQILDTH